MEIYKINDRVYDWEFGWGMIVKIFPHGSTSYPIVVEWDDISLHCVEYTLNGGKGVSYMTPRLSFTEYDFVKGGFSQGRKDMVDTRIGKWGYFWDDDYDGSFYYSRLLSIGDKNEYRYESPHTCFKNFSLTQPSFV